MSDDKEFNDSVLETKKAIDDVTHDVIKIILEKCSDPDSAVNTVAQRLRVVNQVWLYFYTPMFTEAVKDIFK